MADPIGTSKRTEVYEQSINNTNKVVVGSYAGMGVPSAQVTNEIQQVALEPSYKYGEPTKGTWIPQRDNDQANVGDILRIKYSMSIPFFQEWQMNHILTKLHEDTRFNLRSVELYEEKRLLVIEVEVVKNFSPIFIVAVAIIGAIVAGGMIWLTTHSIEKLSTVKIGDYEIKGTPFIFIAILGAAIFFSLKR